MFVTCAIQTQVLLVSFCPVLESNLTFSVRTNPRPCTKAPSTCPMSTYGLRLWPQSSMISARRIYKNKKLNKHVKLIWGNTPSVKKWETFFGFWTDVYIFLLRPFEKYSIKLYFFIMNPIKVMGLVMMMMTTFWCLWSHHTCHHHLANDILCSVLSSGW